MLYAADFETTTDPLDCRVWSYGLVDIDNPDTFRHGICLDDFMEFCQAEGNSKFYFHNLKFDGEFIISWLFQHGFTHVKDRKETTDMTFTTLISDTGMFYTMSVYWKKSKKLTIKAEFYDSLKILPFSVAVVAKAFNTPMVKGEIDYKKPRPVGYIPTPEEREYQRNDCEIVARALKVLFDQDMDRMTQGSNALKFFKGMLPERQFERLFPAPDYDYDIRQSYRGGFSYADVRHKGKNVGAGIVLDVNSLYSWVMHDCPLPFGEGRAFHGRYPGSQIYTLYTQNIRCQFELKPGHIPTIQLKNNHSFSPTEYVTDSAGLDVVLCLTSVDEALFYEHYDVYNEEYKGGWMFKATTGLFAEYIDHWVGIKNQSKAEGNKGMYTLAKLMLNALYGKFALNPNVCSRYPVFIDGVVQYIDGDPEERDPIYIPVGSFVTAWARDKTIRAAQSLYKRFLYADTDSLHLSGTKLPEGLEIDPFTLGAWKHEMTFSKARYIRAKSYIEFGAEPGDTESKWKITCAGMPEKCHQYVNWKNFKPGAQYPGKLTPVHVKGGIVLKDINFTLRV